jgi:hypothetical protein
MAKESFKIGDRVRLTDPRNWDMGNPIGLIITFDRCYVRVLWEGTKWNKDKGYPHLPHEIEHVVKVGEQLTFNFMKEN